MNNPTIVPVNECSKPNTSKSMLAGLASDINRYKNRVIKYPVAVRCADINGDTQALLVKTILNSKLLERVRVAKAFEAVLSHSRMVALNVMISPEVLALGLNKDQAVERYNSALDDALTLGMRDSLELDEAKAKAKASNVVYDDYSSADTVAAFRAWKNS